MKVISTIGKYTAAQPCSLTIGTFDGVHIGHREIIQRLVKSAKEKNHLAVVLTFFPHPRMILQKDTDIRLIDTMAEKEILLAELGVDVLVVHPFSKAFSRQTADEFIRDVLVNSFNIEHLIIGYDHRFGRNREATVEDLVNAGNTYGFTVEQIEAQEISSVNVSSTKIRHALEEGDMKTATTYLNRPFILTGKVIKGKEIGRTIDFPTANLQLEETYKLHPCDGVYLVQATINKTTIYGMMNIGFRPTLKGEERSFEVHFFDFGGNLYDQILSIEVLELIRKEQKFQSLEALKQQLEKDKATCMTLIP